jgi:hypothetical protein
MNATLNGPMANSNGSSNGHAPAAASDEIRLTCDDRPGRVFDLGQAAELAEASRGAGRRAVDAGEPIGGYRFRPAAAVMPTAPAPIAPGEKRLGCREKPGEYTVGEAAAMAGVRKERLYDGTKRGQKVNGFTFHWLPGREPQGKPRHSARPPAPDTAGGSRRASRKKVVRDSDGAEFTLAEAGAQLGLSANAVWKKLARGDGATWPAGLKFSWAPGSEPVPRGAKGRRPNVGGQPASPNAGPAPAAVAVPDEADVLARVAVALAAGSDAVFTVPQARAALDWSRRTLAEWAKLQAVLAGRAFLIVNGGGGVAVQERPRPERK